MKHQHGFSTVGIITLLLVVVAAVTVTGVAVFHKPSVHKDATSGTQTQPAANSSSSAPSSASTVSTQNQVVIPELGITLTVPNAIKDLQYTAVAKVSAQNVSSVDLTTKSLVTAEPACDTTGASPSAFGRLSKTNGQYPSDPSLASGRLVKQFSSFYISYVAPQASCAVSNANAETLLESQRADLQAALSSVQAG